MRPIEGWRIKELADCLHQLALGLRDIQEPEWAQVFSHYEADCRRFLAPVHSRSAEPREMKMFLANIRSCLSDSPSLKDILLQAELSREETEILGLLAISKDALLEILSELELQSIEFVH